MRRLRFFRWAVAACLAALFGGAASATQHLVGPGDDWSNLAPRLRPGDEVVLMPGHHKPAFFENLRGEPDKPIIIRGVGPEHPGVIVARDHGIKLTRPRFVILQDLEIIGARDNGINIDDGGVEESGDSNPWESVIRLRRINVRRTGPAGNHDGIKLSGLRSVTIEDCRVEGWGGSAIDLVGCHEIHIERCTFKGLLDFTQASGVQIKGGSTNVWISDCRFVEAGKRPVNVGGKTGLEFFRPAVPADATPGSRFEADRVNIERCLFLGGDCAVAFVGSAQVVVRRCTIVKPALWVFRILRENLDPRFGPTQRATIGGNLIVWDAGELQKLINVGPGVDAESFRFEENLWHAEGGDASGVDALPGTISFSQVVDVDPQLDAEHRPRNPAADRFGHVIQRSRNPDDG